MVDGRSRIVNLNKKDLYRGSSNSGGRGNNSDSKMITHNDENILDNSPLHLSRCDTDVGISADDWLQNYSGTHSNCECN